MPTVSIRQLLIGDHVHRTNQLIIVVTRRVRNPFCLFVACLIRLSETKVVATSSDGLENLCSESLVTLILGKVKLIETCM